MTVAAAPPTSLPDHEIGQGLTLDKIYSGWDIGGVPDDVADPDSCISLWCGQPGVGKTSLWRCHPSALILNFDCKSAPAPLSSQETTAKFWPMIDANGECHGTGGARIAPSWSAFRGVIDNLINLSLNNSPRPKVIVIDTLAAWIGMLIEFVTTHADKVGLISPARADDYRKSGTKIAWRHLDGRAAWTVVFDEIIETLRELRKAGYGVALICHLILKEITVEEGTKEELRHTMSTGMVSRLLPIVDLSLVIRRRPITIEIPMPPKKMLNNKGEEVLQPQKPRHESRMIPVLAHSTSDIAGITKTPVPLPEEWAIPLDNAYEAFRREYRSAFTKAKASKGV